MSKKINKLSDLSPDPKNFNQHNSYGMGLIEKSMRKFGFMEAGTISEDGVIISGNARQEVAVSIGLDDVQIIDIDGTKPVYLRRLGIKSGTNEFKEVALALNATAKANIVWAEDVIAEEIGIEMAESWGVEINPEPIKTQSEKDLSDGRTTHICPNCNTEFDD